MFEGMMGGVGSGSSPAAGAGAAPGTGFNLGRNIQSYYQNQAKQQGVGGMEGMGDIAQMMGGMLGKQGDDQQFELRLRKQQEKFMMDMQKFQQDMAFQKMAAQKMSEGMAGLANIGMEGNV